jgi:protein-tyrosine phosphatase
MALVLDWQNASQPDDLIGQILVALRQGATVALPTEAGYVFTAAASSAAAVESLRQLLPEPIPLTIPIADLAELGSLLPQCANKIARRCWPGPLTLAISLPAPMRWSEAVPESVAASLQTGNTLRVWMPDHTAVAALLERIDFPLVILQPASPLRTPESVSESFGEKVAILLAAGESRGAGTTEVRVTPESYEITRPGKITEADLRNAEACWIVFVCTGNTCRSPMAEAIFQQRLRAKLGCKLEELPAKGFHVFSAGLAAYDGDGAAPEAMDVIRSFDGDLSEHRSRPLLPFVVAETDHLIAMTHQHLLSIVSRYRKFNGALRLLCGNEGDLDDPLGGGSEVYQECAQKILRHIDRFISEMRVA